MRWVPRECKSLPHTLQLLPLLMDLIYLIHYLNSCTLLSWPLFLKLHQSLSNMEPLLLIAVLGSLVMPLLWWSALGWGLYHWEVLGTVGGLQAWRLLHSTSSCLLSTYTFHLGLIDPQTLCVLAYLATEKHSILITIVPLLIDCILRSIWIGCSSSPLLGTTGGISLFLNL